MATSLDHDARCSVLAKPTSSLVLVIVVYILLTLTSVQGFDCLSRCDCYYKSNKLIAECGSRGLATSLPEEDFDERQKSKRSDIQVLNLTRNTFSTLKSNMFYSANLVNLQRLYLKKGERT